VCQLGPNDLGEEIVSAGELAAEEGSVCAADDDVGSSSAEETGSDDGEEPDLMELCENAFRSVELLEEKNKRLSRKVKDLESEKLEAEKTVSTLRVENIELFNLTIILKDELDCLRIRLGHANEDLVILQSAGTMSEAQGAEVELVQVAAGHKNRGKAAMAGSTQVGQAKKKVNIRKTTTCHHCGKKGHIKPHCWDLQGLRPARKGKKQKKTSSPPPPLPERVQPSRTPLSKSIPTPSSKTTSPSIVKIWVRKSDFIPQCASRSNCSSSKIAPLRVTSDTIRHT